MTAGPPLLAWVRSTVAVAYFGAKFRSPAKVKSIRTPVALSPLVPEAPAQVKVLRGPVSGSILIRASRVAKAASYDVQVTAADPTVEGNWNDAGVYKNCRRIEVLGLTPMKTYSVRMRALGAAGYGPWTPVTSVAVV